MSDQVIGNNTKDANLIYELQGDWNASTNAPDIISTTEIGFAWQVSVAGTTDLGGITDWHINDIAVKTATGWINSPGGQVAWGGIAGNIPNQTDLVNYVETKVTKNNNITGATKTKITYDIKGLVTNGEDATTADINDSLDKRYVTDAQRTVIQHTSNTNTGDETQSTILSKLGYTPVPNTRTVNSKALSSDIILTKSDLGLGNVNNTSDLNKPISTATQNALDLKANDNAVVHLAGNETITGIKTLTQLNITPSGAATSPVDGSLYFDTQDKALTIVTDATNDVNLSIGQEMYIRCINKTGSPINNGQVVFISGAQGNRPKISLAQANAVATFLGTIGVATQDIADNAEGMITTYGLVRDINTSAFSEGDILYLSPIVAGGFTKTMPSSPNYISRIGIVTTSHVTQGAICVHIDNNPVSGRFGDDTNYTNFESDGTMVANGNATCWDDLLPSSVAVQSTGTNAASFTAYNGNLRAYEYVGTGASFKEVNIGWQLSHTWLEGSDIIPHIHLYIPDNAVGGVIKIYGEYTWTNIGQTGAVATTTVSGTITRTANQGVANNIILSLGAITGTGKTISSMFMSRIYRDPTDVADTFGASVWLKSADIHYQKNMLGSRQELIK